MIFRHHLWFKSISNSVLLSEATSDQTNICIYIWPHFDSQISFCSNLHVSKRRTASHLHPSSYFRSSSNRSPQFKHLALFVHLLLLLHCLPFFRVVEVVVVLVAGVVVAVCRSCASFANCSSAHHRVCSNSCVFLLDDHS